MGLFMRNMFRMYGFIPIKDKSESKTTTCNNSDEQNNTVSNTTLQDVDGIGPKYEEKLKQNGINSVKQLNEMSSDDLSEKISISEDYADRWISSAKKLLN